MSHPYVSEERLENLKELQGNFTLTPNYLDLVKGIYNVVRWYYAPKMWRSYSFLDEIARYFYFPLHEVYYIIYIAIGITFLRYAFERFICKVC